MFSWKNIVISMLTTALITSFFLMNQTIKNDLETTKKIQFLILGNINLHNQSPQKNIASLPVTNYHPYQTIKYLFQTNIEFNQAKFTSEYEGYPNRDLRKKIIFTNPRLVPCESYSRADVIILLEKKSENISVKIIDTRSQKNIYYNSREAINLWKYESLIMAFYDKEINNFQSAVLEK